MTKFKDVAHLYLTAKVEVTDHKEDVKHIDSIEGYIVNESLCLKEWGDYYFEEDDRATAKPLLRRLDSLTEEEKIEINKTFNVIPASPVHTHLGVNVWSAQTFAYLLSLHIDLFNLIANNEAIELKP
jgi:hypothetical protein